jgi:hypothetical protein
VAAALLDIAQVTSEMDQIGTGSTSSSSAPISRIVLDGLLATYRMQLAVAQSSSSDSPNLCLLGDRAYPDIRGLPDIGVPMVQM